MLERFDTYLRTNHPSIWALRLHIVLLVLVPAWLIGLALGYSSMDMENIAIYDYNGLTTVFVYLGIVIAMVFWLVYVFRFNKWSQFGKLGQFEGTLTFLAVGLKILKYKTLGFNILHIVFSCFVVYQDS